MFCAMQNMTIKYRLQRCKRIIQNLPAQLIKKCVWTINFFAKMYPKTNKIIFSSIILNSFKLTQLNSCSMQNMTLNTRKICFQYIEYKLESLLDYHNIEKTLIFYWERLINTIFKKNLCWWTTIKLNFNQKSHNWLPFLFLKIISILVTN